MHDHMVAELRLTLIAKNSPAIEVLERAKYLYQLHSWFEYLGAEYLERFQTQK